MAKIRSLNLIPNEIIFPTSKIILDTDLAVEPMSGQNSLQISKESGLVSMTKGGRRLIWIPSSPMSIGRHTLSVNPIEFKNKKWLKTMHQIPFYVVNSSIKIPSSIAVLNIERVVISGLSVRAVRLDKIPREKYFELIKGINRTRNTPISLAFDSRGRRINYERMIASLEKAKLKKYGKLHPSLFNRLQKISGKKFVDVAIWLRVKETEMDPEKFEKKSSRISKQEMVVRHRIELVCRSFEKTLRKTISPLRLKPDGNAPVIYARITRNEITKISKNPQIAGIYYHDTKGIDDLKDSIEIANSDDVHSMNVKGKGVKVAVWENGPDNTSNLTISGFYDSSQSNTSTHARLTNAIIKNKEKKKPHGHAPSCILYSANNYELAASRWAARTIGCTVISQSFHRSDEPHDDNLSYDDVYKDWLVLHWPYPTILQASGNYWSTDPDNVNPPSDEYVNHKGYNSLAVGNHSDDASTMSGSSVFRNPSSSHGDRELPEICANGMGVSAVGRNNRSGTSFAAPAVAGVTALLQSTNTTLKMWPEGCRAILLAGAKRNVRDSTWWNDVIQDIDARDGSGALDAEESVKIAKSRRYRNAGATQRGWDVGSLRSSDFTSNRMSRFSYRVKIPSNSIGGRVKVALAWDSKVVSIFGIPLISVLKLDFDLMIYDSKNRLVGYSGSWDNSYEIAEFDGQAGETYRIKIRRWSGTDSTWYGIAWCVDVIPFVYKLFPHKTILPLAVHVP